MLQSLLTLDYILLVANANGRRVADSTKAIFTKLQNLYTEDLSERVIGMFTFSNGDEPPG